MRLRTVRRLLANSRIEFDWDVVRALTYAMSREWAPLAWTRRSRLRKALWRAGLYWMVTFLRLYVVSVSTLPCLFTHSSHGSEYRMYMLIAMTFSIW